MPNQRLFFIALTLFWLSSCTSDSSQKQDALPQKETSQDTQLPVQDTLPQSDTSNRGDTIDFKTAFTQFLAALHASDTAAMNQFIHPKYGFWVIEQPGAMPRMTHVTNITRFKREYQDRSFFTVREEVKACDLKEEVWPTFDCADMDYDKGQSGYSKNGCFAGKPDKFQKSGYWDYASLSDQEIENIKATLPLMQRSVLHTATSFEFHFGFIDGQWRLLFTKLIYPCSA